MSKDVTMRDIAKRLNMSAVSVSKALSGREGVSDSVRQLILKTAEEMGYVYVSKEEKNSPSYNISVMVSQTFISDSAFYSRMFQNLAVEFGKKHHSCTLEILSHRDEKEGNLPKNITKKHVDGLIVLGPVSSACMKKVSHLEIPCVFLDTDITEPIGDCVVGDNMFGAHLLTDYLIRKGHRRIAYVGNIKASDSIMDRYLGYVKAMLEHGCELKPEYVLNDRDAEGYITDIIFPEEMPEAFVCNCDEVAYHLTEQLKKHGLTIAKEVSVVGFDDYIFATLSNPKLTTFRVNIEEMSRMAVEMMEEKLRNPRAGMHRRVVGGEVVIRDSVRE